MGLKLNSFSTVKQNYTPKFGMKINNTEGFKSLIDEWKGMGYTSIPIIETIKSLQDCADDTYDLNIYACGDEYCSVINDGSKRGIGAHFERFTKPEDVVSAIAQKSETLVKTKHTSIERLRQKAAEKVYEQCYIYCD